MIGFYSPSFRKRKVMRCHKVISLLFLLASTLCLILAVWNGNGKQYCVNLS